MPAIFDSLAFLDPIETITATGFGEVTHALELAERRARAGAYVMVMLSYEAAPVFDSALVTHQPDSFPLAWVGVFSEPSDLVETRSNVSSNPWLPAVTKDEYVHAVIRIRDLIAAGDTYQVNYTFPRSLRSRSTIITFSARFLIEFCNHRASSASS